MKKLSRNSASFSVVEGLLILTIVALVGFIGWYVWHSKNNTDKAYNSASSTSSATVPVDWTTYENKELGFSFAHPKEWLPDVENNLVRKDGKGPSFHIGLLQDGTTYGEAETIEIQLYPTNTDSRTVDYFLKENYEEVSNAKELKVGGIKATQYTWQTKPQPEASYYPQPHLQTFVVNGNYAYYISYTYKYGGNTNKHIADYNALVQSFVFD